MGGWSVAIPYAPKPGPKEELERLKPLELPLLNMAQWKSGHPWYHYQQPPHGEELATGAAITIGLEVLGHFVEALEPVGWIHLGWEFLTLDAERDERAREAQLAAWNSYMWQTFWTNERAYPSADAREAAFDRLAGDNASHGIVAKLTDQAEQKRQELIHDINARWLADMGALLKAKEDLEYYGPKALETAPQESYLHGEQELIDSYKADMKAVLEFESNPANWNLTNEEKALLPEKWQPLFAERDALQARRDSLAAQLPYHSESDPYRQQAAASVAQTDEALERLKEHMASEAVTSAPGPR